MLSFYLNQLKNYHDHCFIVGCSGGVDSMALAHWLIANQFSVHLVHVNYHKRGEASNLDEQLVERFARTNNLAYDIYSFDSSKVSSNNFQEAARQFRYDKLHFIAELYPKSFVALAHHEDDQIETFFMNLSRKSGVLGLCAMPFKNKTIVRPFLKASKNEIITYAKENNIEWREDASNAENDYTRNRWRNEFIPLLEKSIPTLKTSTLTLIDHFQSLQLEIEHSIKETMTELAEKGILSLNVKRENSELHLFEIWRQLGQPASTFDSFLQLFDLEKGKRLKLVGNFDSAVKESDCIYFSKTSPIPETPQLMIESVKTLPTTFTKDSIYLDSKKINGELIIRPWKIGDSIQSIGMKGKQLVSDIIKDAKIAHHAKNAVFVVCDDSTIHWVVGLKVGRLAVANKNSISILKIILD